MNAVYFLVQQTAYFMIPLLIVALAGMFSERSGVTNIALDGMMIIGAFFGIVCLKEIQSSLHSQWALIISLLVGGFAGLLFAAAHAYASVNLKADQVISGTALNIFAPAFAIYIARVIQKVQQVYFADEYMIVSVPVLGAIPVIGPMFFQKCYLTTFIGIGILLVSSFVVYKTRFGLRLRACGENPAAADSAGVNVYRMRYAGVLISGFLGGLGGVVFIVPTSTSFNADVAGYGFLALAVLIFGQWRPGRILFASFFFGLMKTLSAAYASIPVLSSVGLPSGVYKMAPYIMTILVLIFTSKSSQAPKAVGTAYEKGDR